MIQWQWEELPRPSWAIRTSASFAAVIHQDGYIMAFAATPNECSVACVNRIAVYGSSDGGNSWEQFPDAPSVTSSTERDAKAGTTEDDFLLVSVLRDGSLLLLDTDARAAYHSIDRACTWTALPQPKWGRRHGASIVVALSGKVFLVGGENPDDKTFLAEVWCSMDSGSSWQLQSNPPWEGRRDASIAELADGELILVGGIGGKSWGRPLQEIWRSNIGVSDWSMMSLPPPCVRSRAAVASHYGKLLLFGAQDIDAWVLDPDNNKDFSSWAQLPDPPWPARTKVTVLNHYDFLLLIGLGNLEPIPRILKLSQIPADVLKVYVLQTDTDLQVNVTDQSETQIYMFVMDLDSRFSHLRQKIDSTHQKPSKLLLRNGTDLTNLKETYLIRMLGKIGHTLPVWRTGSRVRLSSDSQYAAQSSVFGIVTEEIWLGCGYGRIDFDDGSSNRYRYEDLEKCPMEGDWIGITIEPSIGGINEAKSKANELFAEGRLSDAEKCYSKSIWLLETGQVKHMNKHLPCHYSNKLLSALYSNRALLHLRTRSWNEAKKDGTRALSLDSENLKAKHRRALANFELGDCDASLRDINEILDIISDGQAKRDLLDLRGRIQGGERRSPEELSNSPAKRIKVLPPVPTFNSRS